MCCLIGYTFVELLATDLFGEYPQPALLCNNNKGDKSCTEKWKNYFFKLINSNLVCKGGGQQKERNGKSSAIVPKNRMNKYNKY